MSSNFAWTTPGSGEISCLTNCARSAIAIKGQVVLFDKKRECSRPRGFETPECDRVKHCYSRTLSAGLGSRTVAHRRQTWAILVWPDIDLTAGVIQLVGYGKRIPKALDRPFRRCLDIRARDLVGVPGTVVAVGTYRSQKARSVPKAIFCSALSGYCARTQARTSGGNSQDKFRLHH